MKIKTRRYYIYYCLKAGLFMISLIPRRVSLAIAGCLGGLAFRFIGKYRKIALSNLDMAMGGGLEKNTEIGEAVFRNLAKNGADWLKLISLGRKDIDKMVTETSGVGYLDEALAKGKGMILLASHFGNWELLSIYLWMTGYGGAVIARKIYFRKYDKLVRKLRAKFGAYVVYRDESPKKLLRVLKSGKILGILADQDVPSVDGIFVDFFGRPAYTPTAPVKLGMTTGASLVPAFMIRKPDDTYKMIIERPIELVPRGTKEEDLREYTQAWTDVLERYIRMYPEQWVWIHERWKTQKAIAGV